MYFEVKGEKFSFENGVHQGSPISPSLFNIYLEEFLEELKNKIKTNFFYLAYADDLVIMCDMFKLKRMINTLFKTAQEFNLKVNPKKSNIMAVKNHKYINHLKPEDYHEIKITK